MKRNCNEEFKWSSENNLFNDVGLKCQITFLFYRIYSEGLLSKLLMSILLP